MRLFGWFILLFYIPQAVAQAPTFSSVTECEKAPQQCIAFTQQALESTTLYSLRWYQLKNLNLAAHWQIVDTDPVREEIAQLAQLDDAPAVFRITVLTIYSKLVLGDGNIELAKELINEVTQLIKDVNAVSLNPDRYAELIVLLNAIKEFEQAERVGTELLAMFEQSRRNIELGDFYTALAHTQYWLGEYAKAKAYYQAALTSYTEMQHVLEISNTLHNIARSYQGMQQHNAAIEQFEKALQWRAKAGEGADLRNEQYTRLRMVESLFHVGQLKRARLEFKNIKFEYVLKNYQQLYKDIADLIGYNTAVSANQ